MLSSMDIPPISLRRAPSLLGPALLAAALAAAPLTLGFIWGLSGEPPSDDWSEAEFLIFNSPMEVLTDE